MASTKNGSGLSRSHRRMRTCANSENASPLFSSVQSPLSPYPESPNPITPAFRRMYLSPRSKADSDSGLTPCTDLRIELLQIYLDKFLIAAVLPSLMTSGEQQVLASQIIVRKLLVELMQVSSKGPLVLTTARFLISNKDLIKFLITRAGSVSRSIAVSSLQLLSAMLGAAPLEDAAALVQPT